MSDGEWDGVERRKTYSGVELSLAKIEGKLDAIISVQTATTASVHDLDLRVRELETLVSALKQQISGKLPWTTISAAIVAIVGVGLILAERIYGG